MIYGILDANDNKTEVDIWNVINEVFDQDGLYRPQADMIWSQLGYEEDTSDLSGENKINDQHLVFIRKAFEYARDKTDKTVEYRDYHIEARNPANGWGKKYKATYQILEHIKYSDILIDAIGIQGHYDIGNTDWILENDSLSNVIQKFKALGLEYITELDIGSQDMEWSNELAEQ